VTQDRVGSFGSYYPYGEDKGTPLLPNDQWKFATYTRDSATGLDYAMNRYYSSAWGRFTSPDPYQASGGPSDPQGLNRYSYTRGDPVNRHDPLGLLDFCDDDDLFDGCGADGSPGGTSVGGGGPPISFTPLDIQNILNGYVDSFLGGAITTPLYPNTWTAWLQLIAAAYQANQAKAQQATVPLYRYPAALEVVSETCTLGAPIGSNFITPNAFLQVTYEVLDNTGNAWSSQDGSLTIYENVVPTNGTPISANSFWATPGAGASDPNNTINGKGQFMDNLSLGGLFIGTPGTANQSFLGTGAFLPQPLPIILPNGQQVGYLQNFYGPYTVNLNNMPPPNGCH